MGMRSGLIAALFALACSPTPPPHRPEPEPNACAAACETLERLGCESGKDTEAGGSCEANCLNIEQSGTVSMCPANVARARDCAEAERLSQCEPP